jgi:exonuclease SbcC
MRPISLYLKGFKGIRAGMGIDEVRIDFENIPDGLVVFSAPNGSGKTTILDNLHPFRILPYRTGNSYRPTAFSYYEHVYGDALKEFIFEMDGTRYRSLILIDTERKKQEAYLYRWAGEKWQPLPGIDGKLEQYDQAVESICGSPELFFTSIFRAQGAKALSDYARGDIKELFIELLNINHLKTISEKARRIKQDLSGKAELLTFERNRLREIIEGEDRTRQGLTQAEAAITETEAAMEALADDLITVQEEINECDVQINYQGKFIEDHARIGREIETKRDKIKALNSEKSDKGLYYDRKLSAISEKIAGNKKLIENAPALKKRAENKTAIQGVIAELKEKAVALEAEFAHYNEKITEINRIEAMIAEKEKELQRLTMEQTRTREIAATAVNDATRDAEKLTTVPCSKDIAASCRFVKDAAEAENKLPELRCTLEAALIENHLLAEYKAGINTLKIQTSDKSIYASRLDQITKEKSDIANSIRGYETNLSSIDAALSLLPRVEMAEQQLPEQENELHVLIEEGKEAIQKYDSEIAGIEAEIEGLKIELAGIVIDGSAGEKKIDLLRKIEAIKLAIGNVKVAGDNYRKSIGALEEKLKEVDKAKTGLETVTARTKYLQDEISEWGILEKAFGDNGIIALELDDGGPQISALANELLKVYGGRFTIRIDTQAAKSDGKGNKEVFDITVFDSETNESKSIKRLSGGEKTWVEEAVTRAICLYAASSSGRKFNTLFCDEKDGALDAEKKKEFFQMKRRVLELGGYDREFAITQTPDLQALADAVIRIEKSNINIITN